eukprot:TRINITY_DN17576_c0_g1_i1.p1 TRINITY_DN17576_c0_g1~~TRINITY_DN17576_c0_g1_i1.p1  ORF type:complete len:405 (+),score=61.35 TRINITY_DN17576_c0_g1_i1:101-1315(+)
MSKTVGRQDKLKYVKFGRSDMMVSQVCAGTMTWGSFNDQESQAHEQLDKIVEMGVNFIDTAELYPVAFNYGATTEKWIGNWLKQRSGEGKIQREKLYIATKSNPNAVGAPPLPGRNPMGPHSYDEEMLTHSCKASIERLQCDYIDLYQLHWPSRDVPVFGCANFYPEDQQRPVKFNDHGEPESFEKQVLSIKKLLDAGLIKHWGLSNENAYGITMFCMTCDRLGVPRPISCQNDFSLLNRTYEGDAWEAAYRFGIVGLPYGPLAGGALTGKYLKDSKYAGLDPARPLKDCRHNSQPGFQPRYVFPVPMLATKKYVDLAESWGLTPTELALAWNRDRPCNANGSIIMGTASVKQVEDCINAFKLDPLPKELMKAIDVIFEEFRNPICHYADKATVQEAKWLQSGL